MPVANKSDINQTETATANPTLRLPASKAPKGRRNRQKNKRNKIQETLETKDAAKPESSSPTRTRQNHWIKTEQEEKALIKQFWLCLSTDERRDLVDLEKKSIMAKIKEQQQRSCSCESCVSKREAVEKELCLLYDSYYDELETLVHQNRDCSSLFANVSTSKLPSLFSTAPSHSPAETTDKSWSMAASDPNLLNIAHDVLSNDGKELLHCLEKSSPDPKLDAPQLNNLARSVFKFIANPDAAVSSLEEQTQSEYDCSNDEDDDHMCCSHCCGDSESTNAEYSGDMLELDAHSDCCCHECQLQREHEERMSIERQRQRLQDGRRVFQLFAARMFEQRVLIAYRERIAEERQQQLIAEEELEKKQQLVCETTKKLKQGRKKQQKLMLKQQKAEEQRQLALARLREEEERERERRAKELELAAIRKAEQRSKEEKRLQELAKENKRKELERKRREKERAELDEKKRQERERRQQQKQERQLEQEKQRQLKAERREEHLRRMAERERAQSFNQKRGSNVPLNQNNAAAVSEHHDPLINLVAQTQNISIDDRFFTPVKSMVNSEAANDIPFVAESVVNSLFDDTEDQPSSSAFKIDSPLASPPTAKPPQMPVANIGYSPFYSSPLNTQFPGRVFAQSPSSSPLPSNVSQYSAVFDSPIASILDSKNVSSIW